MPLSARPTSERPAEAGAGYLHHRQWLSYQEFFPGGLRLTAETAPDEQWWTWRGMDVHLDRVAHPDAPAKLVALHGAGGYGRMLAPYGRLPSLYDLDYLAPDLPGFGLTDPGRHHVTYRTWVECVAALLEHERRTDPRPVVLLGVGTGGRLAYDVAAAAAGSVAGVVVTCLADPRRGEVRRRLAVRPELGQWSGLLSLAPWPLRQARVPVHWLANVAAVSNNVKFAELVWADALGGGNWISLSFVRSYLASAPVTEPEEFRGPPVLLAHPDEDRWIPTSLSTRFFDRIAGPTRFAALRGGGHLPVEEIALADLDRAVRDFLDELGLT
ncbi:alpha/beta hydrolase [Saccharopolyspora erythraea]|uniref:alpha/beta hydrolase n=1 Tax=Saccharopolyspora erythraea TaxID=1836 RepID=UPI00201296DC|nr:alpha/beta fold hydrolase [Saccharopolyspora erythraea]